ncbi:MAG TPA: hypothetical protein ENN51_02625 [candidate division WOR-3 bacterium]|uniref:T9SS type A sorting domain-containing protein n=1 Tax=candidate division WOR-3 bacterium TaxID=2052148 RepID=A0A7V0T4R6_UNCW3|nr:hypothetical protein [candidate division WOR-3 bacterium]
MHRKVLQYVGLTLLVLSAVAGAQTTIPWNRIPSAVGTVLEFKRNDIFEPAPVQVGNPGGPHTWTFDTTFAGFRFASHIVDKDETPFGAEFPDANLATRGDDSEPVVAYTFSNLSQQAYDMLGIGMTTTSDTVSVRYDSSLKWVALPLAMGASWRSASSYRIDYDPGSFSVFIEQSSPRVDAHGTAVLPFGSFSCLRVTSVDTMITLHTIGGVPEPPDTFFHRMYWWWAPDLGMIVSATGPDGDTALIFTESDNYNVMVAAPSGAVAERPRRPALGTLRIPSPFTGRTTVPGRTQELFELYDVSGKLVARQQGDAIGRGLPTGIYTVRSGAGHSARVVKLGL